MSTFASSAGGGLAGGWMSQSFGVVFEGRVGVVSLMKRRYCVLCVGWD